MLPNKRVRHSAFLKYLTQDGRLPNGCGSVGVSTGDCGSPGPGSIPGHGPILFNPVVFLLFRVPFFEPWFQGMICFRGLLQTPMEYDLQR